MANLFKKVTTSLAVMLVGVQVCFGLSITSFTKTDDGILCVCNKGVMKVQICKSDIVRVAYSPTSTIPDRPIPIVNRVWDKPSFTQTESGDIITLETSKLKVTISKITANVTYTNSSGEVILSENNKTMTPVTVEGISTNNINTTFNSPTDEGLYGLGQHQDGVANYKGKKETMTQDYGRYATAIPVLVSSKGYGILWDNYSQSKFDGTLSNNSQYSLWSECADAISYYFFNGPEIDKVISNYRFATGSAPMFPKWAYGLIQSKDKYTSQTDYLGVKDGYRKNKIPLDCIVQDWHYWDGYSKQGDYTFNPVYGDVKSTIKQMHDANLHTMLSIWPQVEKGTQVFNQLDEIGGLWQNNATQPGNTRFVNPFMPAALDVYWKTIRDKVFDPSAMGWDSWWLDNDEPLPYPEQANFRAQPANAVLGKFAHVLNTFTFKFTEMGYTNWRRDLSEKTGKRCLILHRAAYAGQQRHAAVNWSNDVQCTWEVLNKSVPAGLNSMITGVPYWCTDIGGYWGVNYDFTTASNQELMTRWFQYGAFLPVFRIHGNMKPGQGKELYSNTWTAATKANLLLIDKLRYRLMPYIYTLAWRITDQDYTMSRHLVMDFRSDNKVKSIGDQFMFGPAFMVSPVTKSGETSRSVYLPEGKWFDFWTGDSVKGGGSINASAPLSKIPLHIRAGSIVPMGPDIQYAAERSDTIELRIYPGADGAFEIYEDEGDNYNYETLKYAKISISYNDNTKEVLINVRSGSFEGMDERKVFNIVYVKKDHGVGEAITATPDAQIVYDGTQNSYKPNVGLLTKRSAAGMLPADFSAKTTDLKVVLPKSFSGRTKEISVYDVSGKLLQRNIIEKNTVDLSKDFNLPSKFYIVKAKAIR